MRNSTREKQNSNFHFRIYASGLKLVDTSLTRARAQKQTPLLDGDCRQLEDARHDGARGQRRAHRDRARRRNCHLFHH